MKSSNYRSILLQKRVVMGSSVKATTPCEAATLMAKSKFLISTRFHAVTFATSNRIPSVSFPANTPKLEALVKDIGSPCVQFSKVQYKLNDKSVDLLSHCNFTDKKSDERIKAMRDAAQRNLPFNYTLPSAACTPVEESRQQRYHRHLSKTGYDVLFTFSERFGSELRV